jgi:putative pyruvate formate lyase activating enzyme
LNIDFRLLFHGTFLGSMGFLPAYVRLYRAGQLKERVDAGYEMLRECKLCARECGVNRLEGEEGFCRASSSVMISSVGPHFGEESPLVGKYGSGTIFLTNCNLGCVFCQNYDISQLRRGKEVELNELANAMVALQKMGCHNINFVTPTHYIPQILAALLIAAENGLRVPLVHNCGGYESVDALNLLEGVFDIYMPDIKYGDNHMGRKYSKAPNYFDAATAAVSEMHRQVGDLAVSSEGMAEKGLLIRHLVLPDGLAGTERVMKYIAKLSKNSYVNIMDQYRPAHRASEHPELSRGISSKEFMDAIHLAEEAGLSRGFSRDRRKRFWI